MRRSCWTAACGLRLWKSDQNYLRIELFWRPAVRRSAFQNTRARYLKAPFDALIFPVSWLRTAAASWANARWPPRSADSA
eukprot:9311858-Pyramimonas_sp.AAC.1